MTTTRNNDRRQQQRLSLLSVVCHCCLVGGHCGWWQLCSGGGSSSLLIGNRPSSIVIIHDHCCSLSIVIIVCRVWFLLFIASPRLAWGGGGMWQWLVGVVGAGSWWGFCQLKGDMKGYRPFGGPQPCLTSQPALFINGCAPHHHDMALSQLFVVTGDMVTWCWCHWCVTWCVMWCWWWLVDDHCVRWWLWATVVRWWHWVIIVEDGGSWERRGLMVVMVPNWASANAEAWFCHQQWYVILILYIHNSLLMSILATAFCMPSFLSIPGTIPATNQERHHSTGIFVPWNEILAGLCAKIDSSGFHRNDWNPAGISGAWLRPQKKDRGLPTCFLFCLRIKDVFELLSANIAICPPPIRSNTMQVKFWLCYFWNLLNIQCIDSVSLYPALFNVFTLEDQQQLNTSPICTYSNNRWYTLHGDECESAQNAKQGSSASGKTLKHLTLTH